MNIFEFAIVTSPIAGAIGGGVGAKAVHSMPVALGAGIGFGIGIVAILAVLGVVNVLIRAFGIATTKPLNPIQWLVSMTAVLLPAASPILAWAFARLIVANL